MQTTFTPKYTFGEYEGRLILLFIYIYACAYVHVRARLAKTVFLCFCVFVRKCRDAGPLRLLFPPVETSALPRLLILCQ